MNVGGKRKSRSQCFYDGNEEKRHGNCNKTETIFDDLIEDESETAPTRVALTIERTDGGNNGLGSPRHTDGDAKKL